MSSHESFLPWGYCARIANAAIVGHKAQQVQHELTALLALLSQHDIGTVLEIGTADGGLAWALLQVPHVTQVLSVDLNQPDALGSELTLPHGTWSFVRGDSTTPRVSDQVRQALGHAPVDLLVIDGDHAGDGPMLDWAAYHGMVRSGGLAVLHDTQGYPGHPEWTVPALWAKLRTTRPSLELVARPGGPGGTGILWM